MKYPDIDAILAKFETEYTAAESHGMATGMLCGNIRTETGFWLREIAQESGEVGNDELSLLENFFEETRGLLSESDYSFELFLPDDDISLSDRVEAFGYWCQGFLYGIGAVGKTENWPEEGREIMRDIAEFTKLDPHAEGEEAENDLMEITEYLRAAVLFLHTELNSRQNGIVH